MNPNKIIVGVHPVINEPVNLKWYRGASRYNNGATRYNRRYRLRCIIGWAKDAKRVAVKWPEYNRLLSEVIVADKPPMLMQTMLPV